MRRATLAILFVLGCSRFSRPVSEPLAAHVILFVASDLRGYLGPCGCSENMRGGIARAAAQIAVARREGLPVAFLEGGNSLFGHSPLGDAEAPQEKRKAQALAQALVAMRLEMRAPGPLDDAAGVDFRKLLRLPEIQDLEVKTVNLGGHPIAIVAGHGKERMQTAAALARRNGAAFVLELLSENFEQAMKDAGNGNAVVATRTASEFEGEDNRITQAAIAVAQMQSKGRSLLRLDLFFGGTGELELERSSQDLERELQSLDQRIELLKRQIDEPGQNPDLKKLRQEKLVDIIHRRLALLDAPPPRIEGKNAFTLRFVPLETSLPSDPQVERIVAAYDEDVSRLNLQWARAHGSDCPQPGTGQAAFVGSKECEACHEEAFQVWRGTPHFRAYETLAAKGKQFHLDCIGCHVTGFQKPGGVCRVDRVDRQKGVGCESCHGAGSRHSADANQPIPVAKPQAPECIGCHNAENSPHFDFALYLPQVLGPGHGKPVAKK